MPKYLYHGPAETLNGEPVPAEGLEVELSEEAWLHMAVHGHQFEDMPAISDADKPTPQEVNRTQGAAAIPMEQLASVPGVVAQPSTGGPTDMTEEERAAAEKAEADVVAQAEKDAAAAAKEAQTASTKPAEKP